MNLTLSVPKLFLPSGNSVCFGEEAFFFLLFLIQLSGIRNLPIEKLILLAFGPLDAI